MRRISRPSLSHEARRALAERASRVLLAGDPAAEAERLWRRDVAALAEVERILRAMARAAERCMYCEDNEGTDVDHFWPKSRYPERAFEWPNLLLACSGCNSNHKRTRFPLDAAGVPLLLDPTSGDPREEPHEHLALSPTTGAYVELSPRGEASIEVYGLNRATLQARRAQAWRSLQTHIIAYDRFATDERLQDAEDVARTIREEPHVSVLVDLLRAAEMPNAHHFVRLHGCLDALGRRPEIRDWARGG